MLGATMWFFIFYRAKQDGAVLLVSVLGGCVVVLDVGLGGVTSAAEARRAW